MRLPKFDVSVMCFCLVMAAAIPVAALRAKTYSIGYELGKLKNQEKNLRRENIRIKYDLATVRRVVRDKYLSKDSHATALQLPNPKAVIRVQDQPPLGDTD